MGQRAPDDPALVFTDELIGTTLFSSGRPVLIVPHIAPQRRPGGTSLSHGMEGARPRERSAMRCRCSHARSKSTS
jgi:hypothetical protein